MYKLCNYLILIVPLWVLFSIRIKKVRLPWLKLIPLTLLCCFADNIVSSFYSHLFDIISSEKKILAAIDPSAGPDFLNLRCTVLNDSTCIISGKLFLKNKTEKTLFFDSSSNVLNFETDSIPPNNNLDDSTLFYSKQFIESVSPDSFVFAKSVHNEWIFEPRESGFLFFYCKMKYSIKNVESFLRFRHSNSIHFFTFHLYINMIDEDGHNVYYKSERGILNFMQDVESINRNVGALITYRTAERNLRQKGVYFESY